MKNFIYVLGILLISGATSWGQSISEGEQQISAEVNATLWKSFKQSWEERDAQVFNSLHTDDVVRVNSWGIKVGEEYKASIRQSYAKPSGTQREIHFRFEMRKYAGDVGYEVGYYRIAETGEDGEVGYDYARFQVSLRREDGQWKISQDWDADQINGTAVTEEDFDRLVPVDL